VDTRLAQISSKQYADSLAEGLASHAAILNALRKANIEFEN
jgi:hypothetical protein